MYVIVYSGESIIEEITCISEEQVSEVAYYWREEGFTVKIVDSLDLV